MSCICLGLSGTFFVQQGELKFDVQLPLLSTMNRRLGSNSARVPGEVEHGAVRNARRSG